MRAVIYARVSSTLQRDRDTIASQLRVLPEFVARMGWELEAPANTYVDDGRTAKAGHLAARTGFTALLRDAAARRFDVVVVVDVDRLTRSEDMTERGEILGALQRAGVKIASAISGQVLDLSTSMGDLFTSLHAYFAAEWSRKHRERVTQGRLTGIQRGHKPTGRIAYGLAWDRDAKTWSIDPIRGPALRELFERYVAGERARAIADDLQRRGVPAPAYKGAWNELGIVRLLQSRHALGELEADSKRKLTIAVPAIVDVDLWLRAQTVIASRRRVGLSQTRNAYLLEGVGACAICGASIFVQSGSKSPPRPPSYFCSSRRRRRAGDARCPTLPMRAAVADDVAWTAIAAELLDPELAERIEQDLRGRAGDHDAWEKDAAGYRAHLERLERVQVGVVDRYHRGLLTDGVFEQELERLRRDRTALQRQLDTAHDAVTHGAATAARLDDVRRTLDDLRGALADADFATRRKIVQLLVPKGGFAIVSREAIRLTLLVPRGSAVGGLVMTSVSNSHHQTPLRVRVLARVTKG